MQGICELCQKQSELQLSHIIPAFVIRWMKRTSPSYLRSTEEPNRRIQDGEKEYMLCLGCEKLFAGWERVFYQELFLMLHPGEPVTAPIPYGPWALKFAVSISFRVLSHYRKVGLSDYPVEQQASAVRALNCWREFLLGVAPNPGGFEQHLLPVDVIESHTMPGLSPFMNRYLVRAFQIDVLTSKDSVLVYTKLGRILLFGFIHEKRPHTWKGTKLHLKKGYIRPTTYHVPEGVIRYLNEQADRIGNASASVSPGQSRKISEALMRDPETVASSEIFRATHYDVLHSGEKALSLAKRKLKDG